MLYSLKFSVGIFYKILLINLVEKIYCKTYIKYIIECIAKIMARYTIRTNFDLLTRLIIVLIYIYL